MMIELKVPAVGESITEVEIGSWLKAEGATVAKDEPVAVIETEKATVELPAPESGTLVKILKQQGETAKVGETIAHLEAGKTEPTAATNPAPPPKTEKSPSAPARATPLAKRVLAEHDLRVDEVPATGPGGRVSKADVLQHVEQLQKEKTSAPATSADKAVSPSPAPVAKSGTPAREEQVVRMTLAAAHHRQAVGGGAAHGGVADDLQRSGHVRHPRAPPAISGGVPEKIRRSSWASCRSSSKR